RYEGVTIFRRVEWQAAKQNGAMLLRFPQQFVTMGCHPVDCVGERSALGSADKRQRKDVIVLLLARDGGRGYLKRLGGRAHWLIPGSGLFVDWKKRIKGSLAEIARVV